MTYHGRHGPNVTEYVRNTDNLNEIPESDIPSASLEYDMEADLAMFTNTNFYDFELGAGETLPVDGFAGHIDGDAATPNVDMKSLEFTQGMPNRCRLFFALYGVLFSTSTLFMVDRSKPSMVVVASWTLTPQTSNPAADLI